MPTGDDMPGTYRPFLEPFVTPRFTARRFSHLAALGAVSFAAACATEAPFTAPDESSALMSAADAMVAVQAGPPEFVPGEVLVQFKEGATASARARALGRVGGAVAEDILTAAMRAAGRRVGVTRVRVGGDVERAIAALRADADVEFAEPNWIYRHQATSNDTYVTNGSLWGMTGTFGSRASVAWAAGKLGSPTVYVGIIDEGYMFSHSDLSANAGVNPGEVAGNGRDDDANGYVDDVRGWDFDGNNASVFDGTQDDHGTHVAGTIGGVGGNGSGVAGVVWNVKLLGAKFLGRNGGTTANAIKAVDYFTDLKTKQGLNLVATNNSWGGGGFSQGLKDAIDRANTAGILFVAAAGNSGTNNDATASYPSGYASANIIAVASITSGGALSSFSQYGATTVDIGAPGSSIWSTVPGRNNTSSYASYSGTSMATPHVTGAVALFASVRALAPKTSADAIAIKNAIFAAGAATSSLAGITSTGKRLDVSSF